MFTPQHMYEFLELLSDLQFLRTTIEIEKCA